jgi:hypothetical protein
MLRGGVGAQDLLHLLQFGGATDKLGVVALREVVENGWPSRAPMERLIMRLRIGPVLIEIAGYVDLALGMLVSLVKGGVHERPPGLTASLNMAT